MSGTLYIVATPIGNLEDVTMRALRILKEVALIAAEDTRYTQKLLSHYVIRTPLTSYHEHNEKTKCPALIQRLLRGESIALVSNAGTPAISDPGYRLAVAAVAAGVQITPVPGPAALIAALSAAALPTDSFVFEGFLAEKKQERRERLQALRGEKRTLIFYEAPHRLMGLLHDMMEILGDREIVLAREISKVHEEFLRGRVGDVIEGFAGRDVKGELTLVIRGAPDEHEVSPQQLENEIDELKARGLRVKEIAEVLGEKYGYAKKEIYALALRRGG